MTCKHCGKEIVTAADYHTRNKCADCARKYAREYQAAHRSDKTRAYHRRYMAQRRLDEYISRLASAPQWWE